MREYLFRGKTEDGKWLEGYLHKIDGIGKGYTAYAIQVQDIDSRMCRPHSHEVISETVGQFTGLTDKNGKKIFEGDIVKTKFGRLCVVEWRSTQCFCGFDFTVCICNANNKTKAPSVFDLYFPENLEIVGNIFDNPELLGE